MERKAEARQTVKDRLFSALIKLAGQKDWSSLTVTELIEGAGVARASFYRNFKSVEEIIDYGVQQMARRYHEGKPSPAEDFHSREMMLYKFQFYQRYANIVLAYHDSKMSTSLLDVITDCEIEAWGDMPASSISKYQLYYYAGAFYNMMLCWLESGAKESPEAMADEFLRIAGKCSPSQKTEK